MSYQNKFRIATILIFIIIAQLFFACKNESNPVEAEPTQSENIETEIKTVLDSIIANTDVPGLVAGIWAPNEGIDLVYSAGVADLETNEPMDAEMVFRIASNTKTFTITVLLQLVDEGVLSLDDKLSKYYPTFPRGDEVTIEMLTNMRSGIYNYVESNNFWSFVITNPLHYWSVEEIINFALTDNPDNLYYFDPGTSFHYSNTNTILIEYIIEQVTGITLEAHINTRIIVPLGLSKTYYVESGTEIPGYHSKAYYLGDTSDDTDLSEYFDYSFARAAGGAISDVFDLKTYVHALTDGSFLSDSLQNRRMDCLPVNGSTMKYGIGIFDNNGFYGHNGGTPGYTSLMVHSPELNCTIVVWYNGALETEPKSLLNVIPQIIYHD